jgi:hypothetical protein
MQTYLYKCNNKNPYWKQLQQQKINFFTRLFSFFCFAFFICFCLFIRPFWSSMIKLHDSSTFWCLSVFFRSIGIMAKKMLVHLHHDMFFIYDSSICKYLLVFYFWLLKRLWNFEEWDFCILFPKQNRTLAHAYFQ